MSQKVSILGSGWLGFDLAKSFKERGHAVSLSTTSKEKLISFEQNDFIPYLVNIDSLEKADSAFFNSQILIVNITSKNVKGFHDLIKHVANSSIEKVLFISSTSVYPFTNDIVTELNEVKDCELVTIENMFQASDSFNSTIIRFAGLYDELRHPGKFIKPGRIIQNPDGYVNLIHKEDCIQIILEIINQNVWGMVFNGSSDNQPVRSVFYTEQTNAIGKEPPKFNYEKPSQFKIIDNSKLKHVLNYTFKHQL